LAISSSNRLSFAGLKASNTNEKISNPGKNIFFIKYDIKGQTRNPCLPPSWIRRIYGRGILVLKTKAFRNKIPETFIDGSAEKSVIGRNAGGSEIAISQLCGIIFTKYIAAQRRGRWVKNTPYIEGLLFDLVPVIVGFWCERKLLYINQKLGVPIVI
jgi:hypothetical protein